jgi:hypothetical protein
MRNYGDETLVSLLTEPSSPCILASESPPLPILGMKGCVLDGLCRLLCFLLFLFELFLLLYSKLGFFLIFLFAFVFTAFVAHRDPP